MRSRYLKNILILLSIVVYVIIYRMYIFTNYIEISNLVSICFVTLLLAFSIIFYGFKNNKHQALEKSLLKTTFLFIAFIVLLVCVYGIFHGFLRNAYSLDISSIIHNSYSVFIILIMTELFRYNYFRANCDNSFFMILGTIAICLFDFFTTVGVIDFTSSSALLKIVTLSLFPIIVKNYMLSYITSVYGYKVPIIYRIITEMYVFIIPIIPDIGEFIQAGVFIVLPALIYMYAANKFTVYMEGIRHVFSKKDFKWSDVLGIVGVMIFIILLSGSFEFSFLGIASGSMKPEFDRGDAVFVKRVKEDEKLKKGDIIAYQNDDRVIVHRIVEVKQNYNGDTYYKTKGDANNSVDDAIIYNKNIKGKVLFDIKYVAYPTVLLNDLISGR